MWRQSFLFLFPFPVCSENEAFLFSALCSPQSCLTRSLPADSLPFSARFGWKQCSFFRGAGEALRLFLTRLLEVSMVYCLVGLLVSADSSVYVMQDFILLCVHLY